MAGKPDSYSIVTQALFLTIIATFQMSYLEAATILSLNNEMKPRISLAASCEYICVEE
jgi:hypothetical protein